MKREKIEVLKNRKPAYNGMLQLGVNEAGEYIIRTVFMDKKYTSYNQAIAEFERLCQAGY